MTKKTRITTNTHIVLSLVNDEEVAGTMGEAFATIMSSPAVVWAKFVLTDDKPNGNNQRVPIGEFKNLINTGVFMPVKMAEGSIEPGHEDSRPLGVITHLVQKNNTLVALAALWSSERPADVQYVKDLVSGGEPVDVSWEILYGDYAIDDAGTMELLDLTLTAATIVGNPAYRGRTPILAVAAKKWSKAYAEKLPFENFLLIDEEGNKLFAYKDATGLTDPTRFQPILEEIAAASITEELKTQVRQQVRTLREMAESGTPIQDLDVERIVLSSVVVAESEDNNVEELELLKTQLQDAQNALAVKEQELASKVTELASILAEKEAIASEALTVEEELKALREFKSQIDAQAAKESKLDAIRTKFGEAGIDKTADYFSQNMEHLLGLDDAGLEFMLQELVAFKDTAVTTTASLQLPNLQPSTRPTDVSEIVKGLREHRSRK